MIDRLRHFRPRPPRADRRSASRRAATLVELVVVIGILAILLAVAIPVLRFDSEDRRLREGARELTAFIERAKARAVEIGRPAGIWIERQAATTVGAKQGVRVFLCETPPTFSGSTQSSRVVVANPNNVPGTPAGFLFFNDAEFINGITPTTISLDRQIILSRVPPGGRFRIRFDHRAPDYWVERVEDNAGSLQLMIVSFVSVPDFIRAADPAFAVSNGLTPLANGMPFTVLFPPRRVTGRSIEFPRDVVIDLSVSGMTASGFHFAPPAGVADPRPVLIIFSPRGNIDAVTFSTILTAGQPPEMVTIPPIGHVFLMMGRASKLVAPPGGGPFSDNVRDASTIWVTVNHLSGKVTTAENVDITTSNVPPPPSPPPGWPLVVARQLARTSVRMGGR